MRRFISSLVCVTLLLALCSCIIDTQEGAVTTTRPFTLSSDVFENYASEVVSNVEGVITNVHYSDSYDSSKVRDFFLEAALGSSSGNDQTVCRWTQHIDYFIDGKIPDNERENMEQIILTLNGIGVFPGMTQTDIREDAEIVIYYTNLNTLHELFQTKDTVYTDESGHSVTKYTVSAGYFNVDTSTGEIQSAEIGISIQQSTSEQRCSGFARELLKVCGLPFKSSVFPESILFSGEMSATEPAEIDYMALDILYNEKLRCGAGFSESFITVVDILTK